MLILIVIFTLGYILITLEHSVKITKSATSLFLGVALWVVYGLLNHGNAAVLLKEHHHLEGIAELVLFLLGAMTIVELIAAHNGFKIITDFIQTKSKRVLLWSVGFLTFFLSAFLDNVTTTIVMVKLLHKILESRTDRLMFCGLVIIAANAGGAWTPIGDITTTMLWIGGQITPINIMGALFIPSLVSILIPMAIMSFFVKGHFEPFHLTQSQQPAPYYKLIFMLGTLSLVSVPVFKTVTHFPPYMGMMFGLSILWIATEILHTVAERHHLKVGHALARIDGPTILFIIGILLSVSALESSGILHHVALWFDDNIPLKEVSIPIFGGISAIIDNIPLMAAVMGMYDLNLYPTDHKIWELLAFAVGTGGSMLIIGSSSGVVAMGIEKIDFFWYLRKITWIAALGYIGGIITYLWLYPNPAF